MDSSLLLRTTAFLILLSTLLHALHRYLSTRSKSLPPGPPPDSWLFGHKIPNAFAYRKFEEWTKIYGPVFSLRQGFTHIVVVGRHKTAVEIMEREGAALVDRPVSIAAGETLSGGMRVVLTPAGDRFKKMRKALHAYLAPKVIQSYTPLLMRLAKQHILDITFSPSLHQNHAKRYAASVVMSLAYGKLPTAYDDPDVLAVNRCLTRLGENVRPGLWKVDFFPLLRYVPGYLDELKKGHKEELGLFRKHLELVKEQMQKDHQKDPTGTLGTSTTPDSFAKYLLERQSHDLSLSTNETAYLAGALFGAGSDTTASAISVSVLAAACYPDAARRVQEEIEGIAGKVLRPPVPGDWASSSSTGGVGGTGGIGASGVAGGGAGGAGAAGGKGIGMPELYAFVLESFRWRPVTAGGFPHRSTRDIAWGGYVIPKGATVIGNPWSVGRDPEVFGRRRHRDDGEIDDEAETADDLEKFDPQRWIEHVPDPVTGELEKRVRQDLKSFPFGFGRRVCPGQHMAFSSVLLNTALVLWAFTIRPDNQSDEGSGESGGGIDELAFTESANAHPMPFKVVFEPRAGKTMEEVRELLEGYGED